MTRYKSVVNAPLLSEQLQGFPLFAPSSVATLPYHRTGPWTERAAAVAGRSAAATHRAMILTYLDRRGDQGATADEIDRHFSWVHLTAARRLSDLDKVSVVSCAGDTRPSTQGHPARVYRTIR